MMSNIRALGRFRLAALATILLLVMVLAAGSLFAANERENPDIQPVGESVQLEGIDPGLDAKPPTADKVEPPAVVIETEPGDGADPGAGQEIPDVEGSGSLSRWLADSPDEMGPFSTQDVLAADEIDVEWILYQAVAKDVMTEAEADDFRAWFNERPSFEEAPELLEHQPGTIYRPGDGENTTGTSGGFKSY
jgi:hypothetical protein